MNAAERNARFDRACEVVDAWCPTEFPAAWRARVESIAEEAAARELDVESAVLVALASFEVGITPMGVS